MRVTYDIERDLATIYLSEERQSYDGGATYLLVVDEGEQAEPDSAREPVVVQIGFEGYERLLWIQVDHASRALPEALLRHAHPERLSAPDESEPPDIGNPA